MGQFRSSRPNLPRCGGEVTFQDLARTLQSRRLAALRLTKEENVDGPLSALEFWPVGLETYVDLIAYALRFVLRRDADCTLLGCLVRRWRKQLHKWVAGIQRKTRHGGLKVRGRAGNGVYSNPFHPSRAGGKANLSAANPTSTGTSSSAPPIIRAHLIDCHPSNAFRGISSRT
jgi:hypothetical protein